MHNYIKRRRRLLVSAAVGVASAAAVYYWWHKEDSETGGLEAQQASQGLDGQARASHLDSLEEGEEEEDEEQSMDNSMSTHFDYIQNTSTPQELEQLLPRLRRILYEMTDVQAALARLPPGSPVEVKLRVMAQHSLARPLAASWLIPLVDLLARAKLNIIGRHMFLEEKLGRLRQPQPQMPHGIQALAQAVGIWGGGPSAMGSLPQPLPPRIHHSAIQAFLDCSYLATMGCPWLVTQVLHVVEASLSLVDLNETRSPNELCELVRALHADISDALNQTLGGCWEAMLLGASHTPGPHQARDIGQLSSGILGPPGVMVQDASIPLDSNVAQMAAELQQELRLALSSVPFSEAVDAAVQHTLRALLVHVNQHFPAATSQQNSIREKTSGEQEAGRARGGSAGGQGAGAAAEPAQGTAGGAAQGWAERCGVCSAGRTAWSAVAWALGRVGSGASAAGVARHQASAHDSGSGSMLDPDEKPPRQLPRLLKPTQLACDPLFDNANKLSQATAALGPVLALTASIFAYPLNQPILEEVPSSLWMHSMSGPPLDLGQLVSH